MLAIQGDFAEGLQNLGLVYAGAKRWKEAASCFERMTVLQPENIEPANNAVNSNKRALSITIPLALMKRRPQRIAFDPL